MAIMQLYDGSSIVFTATRLNVFALTLFDQNGVQTQHILQIVPKTQSNDDYSRNLRRTARVSRRITSARYKILISDRGGENSNIKLKFYNNIHIYCVLHRISTLIYLIHNKQCRFKIRRTRINLIDLKHAIETDIFFPIPPPPLAQNRLAKRLKDIFNKSYPDGNESFSAFMMTNTEILHQLYLDLEEEINFDPMYGRLVSFFEFYSLLRRVAGLFFENYSDETRQVFTEFTDLLAVTKPKEPDSLKIIFEDIRTSLHFINAFNADTPYIFQPRIHTTSLQYNLQSFSRKDTWNKKGFAQKIVDSLPLNRNCAVEVVSTSSFDRASYNFTDLPFEFDESPLMLPPPLDIPNEISQEIQDKGDDLLERYEFLIPYHAVIYDALYILQAAENSDYFIHLVHLPVLTRNCIKALIAIK